jgi:hypothetical protein
LNLLPNRFPKYLIHLNLQTKSNLIQAVSVKIHSTKKSPDALNDLQAENIHKSIKEAAIVNSAKARQSTLERNLLSSFARSGRLEYAHGLYKERKVQEIKQKPRQSVSSMEFYQPNKPKKLNAMTEDDFMDVFKTNPPFAYRRPTLKRSKSVINKINSSLVDFKADRVNRSIYYEAVSSDNVAGNVFLKYLQTTNKTVFCVFFLELDQCGTCATLGFHFVVRLRCAVSPTKNYRPEVRGVNRCALHSSIRSQIISRATFVGLKNFPSEISPFSKSRWLSTV